MKRKHLLHCSERAAFVAFLVAKGWVADRAVPGNFSHPLQLKVLVIEDTQGTHCHLSGVGAVLLASWRAAQS